VHLSYPLHPFLHRAHEVLEPYFIRDIIVSKKNGGHGLLCSEEQYMKVLNLLPECATIVRETLHDNWSTKRSTPAEKWDELKKHVSYHLNNGDLSGRNTTNAGTNQEPRSKKVSKSYHTNYEVEKNRQLLELFCTEVVLRYTYPRLDINVSKMRNHLLKSPFCIHPKTGRVCVPISKSEYNTFNPFTVPTISQIMQEYFDATKKDNASVEGTIQKENSENADESSIMKVDENATEPTITTTMKSRTLHKEKKNAWEYTSLYPYYQKYQTEFLVPLQKEVQALQRNMTDETEAMNIDF
jgi:DNA primase small subunit